MSIKDQEWASRIKNEHHESLVSIIDSYQLKMFKEDAHKLKMSMDDLHAMYLKDEGSRSGCMANCD